MEELKHLIMAVTNQNEIQDNIKSRLNSGNVCFHSVQNLLFSCLQYKNLKIKTYKTITLPVYLYGFEAWSLNVKMTDIDSNSLLTENSVLRRIF
jgi:hypothetical protein